MKYVLLKEKMNSKTCGDKHLLTLLLYSTWYGHVWEWVRNGVCVTHNFVTKTRTLTVIISGEFIVSYSQCRNKILMASGLNIIETRGNNCHTMADSKGHGRMSTGHRTARLAIWRLSLGDDCVEKQYDSSKIKSELFFITVENEWPKIYARQIYFLTDGLDVLAYIAGYEVMTDGQISAYSVSYCSKKRDIGMNNKRGVTTATLDFLFVFAKWPLGRPRRRRHKYVKVKFEDVDVLLIHVTHSRV
jgi:hypothetical protein